jgi:ELWxxDGT repeat protein
MRRSLCVPLLAAAIAAQPVQLVRDINSRPAPAESLPRSFVRVGGNTFFSARTAASGRELWRTDGTAGGTIQLTEIVAGIGDGNPDLLTPFGQQLLFAAGDQTAGQSLWTSDGTLAGTRQLRQFEGALAIAAASLPGLALVATTTELWRTDGTVAGTVLLRQMPAMSLNVFNSARLGNELLFTRADEVWRTDGTAAGTRLISARALFSNLAVIGSRAFFGAPDGLRSYDGATVQTIAPGAAPWLVSAAGTTVFWGSSQLFALDTQTPGAQPQPLGISAFFLQPLGNRMAIYSEQLRGGVDVWLSDGTAAGTTVALDLEPEAIFGRMFTLGAQLLFGVARGPLNSRRVELWRIVANPTQVTVLATFRDDSWPDSMAVDAAGQLALFRGTDAAGAEPWVTDGTVAGTRLLRDLETTPATASSGPYLLQRVGNLVYCGASDGFVGSELWRTDGVSAQLVADLEPGREGTVPYSIGSHAGYLYFLGNSPRTYGLWSLAPSRGAVPRRLVVQPYASFRVAALAPLDATRAVAFMEDSGLNGAYVTDGVTATRLPVDVDAGPQPILVGGLLFFAGLVNGQRELVVTDGTAANTRVIDLNGNSPGFPGLIAPLGRELLFWANDFGNVGLHATDGTRAGTRFIAPAPFGNGLSLGDRVVMVAEAADRSVELRVTDGTAGGTRLIANLGAALGVGALAALDGRALVPTSNALWGTDGTVAGTVRLASNVALSDRAVTTGGEVAWRCADGLFVSDGTPSGSRLLATSGRDVVSDPVLLDHRLLFVRNHPVLGSELFSVEIGASAAANGVGCGQRGRTPSLRSGAPRLGGAVRLQAADLPATGVAALLFAPRATAPLAFAAGRCALYLDVAQAVALPPLAFSNGRLDLTLVVPAALHLDRMPLAVQAAIAAPLGLEVSNGIDWTLGW